MDKRRYGDYDIVVRNEQCSILKYNGTESNVIIPDSFGGIPVIGIHPYAFAGNQMIGVTFPDKLSGIKSLAFINCKNLKFVKFGSEINHIDKDAFKDCDKLKKECIDDIEYIDSIVCGCKNKRKISNLAFKEGTKGILEDSFSNCKNLKSIIIPEGVKFIGEDAFKECTNLVYVELKKVLFIDDSAFQGCKSLVTVKAPYLFDIGKKAFDKCKKLDEFIIGKFIRKMDKNAFKGCKKLKQVCYTCSENELKYKLKYSLFDGNGIFKKAKKIFNYNK